MSIRKLMEAKRILDAERKDRAKGATKPTITPPPLPVDLMELTLDEANSGEYDDWLDKQADVVLHEPEYIPGTQWDD